MLFIIQLVRFFFNLFFKIVNIFLQLRYTLIQKLYLLVQNTYVVFQTRYFYFDVLLNLILKISLFTFELLSLFDAIVELHFLFLCFFILDLLNFLFSLGFALFLVLLCFDLFALFEFWQTFVVEWVCIFKLLVMFKNLFDIVPSFLFFWFVFFEWFHWAYKRLV